MSFIPSSPVIPSAPTFEEVEQAYTRSLSVDEKNLILNKTQDIATLKIPSDSIIYSCLSYLGSFFSSKKSNLEVKAEHFLKAGNYLLAIEQGHSLTSFKTDEVFMHFFNHLSLQHREPHLCYKKSIELNPDVPEAYFAMGQLLFNQYFNEDAIYYFNLSLTHAKNLTGSSGRKHAFEELLTYCLAGSYERNNQLDLALQNYIKAGKIAESSKYEEAQKRTFSFLKQKPSKTLFELETCIEFNPKDPELYLDLGHLYLQEEQFEKVLETIHLANQTAFNYDPKALYRVAGLVQDFALHVNSLPSE